MKVVQINSTCGQGSTGKICVAISELLTKNDIENYIFYTQGNSNLKNSYKLCSKNYKKVEALKARVLGNYGFNSNYATKKAIKLLNEIKPDVVHFHNVHGHDLNIEKIFKYLKDKKIKVLYTFHDCWAFTGYCTHFTIANCVKWKEECHHCSQRKSYSWFFDKSKKLYKKKKDAFSNLDMTIITPSNWLKGLVEQSFLKNYPVKVINNGIDLSIFKPSESDFIKKYGITSKYVVLGVSFGWTYKKGLDVFIKLSEELGEDYQVVLVGTNDEVDRYLPKNIISIHRTDSQEELAKIYSSANVFVNPTRQETYPTVNMESLACGTPVITFNTGGSPEIIDEKTGIVVDYNDTEGLTQKVKYACENEAFKKEDCLNRAKNFSSKDRFIEYLSLYKEIK